MDIKVTVALNNFKRAYNDLIGAIEGESIPETDVTLNHYEITSDIGTFRYFAKNEHAAKVQFRNEHGYNHIFINRVKELTSVDKSLQR